MEPLKKLIENSVIGTDGKPNLLGMGMTAVLAGGVAFFTSGMGILPMLVSTLAVGGLGMVAGNAFFGDPKGGGFWGGAPMPDIVVRH